MSASAHTIRRGVEGRLFGAGPPADFAFRRPRVFPLLVRFAGGKFFFSNCLPLIQTKVWNITKISLAGHLSHYFIALEQIERPAHLVVRFQ